VAINGEELNVIFFSNYEVSVTGKPTVAIFIRDECVDLLYYVSPSMPDLGATIFSGKDITILFKSSTMVLISGTIEKITFLNKKGDVVKTYKLNDCDKEFAFVEE
jgi:hypothetical protein